MKSKVEAIEEIEEIIHDLGQGKDNGGMKRISLSSFLRSLVPILEAAQQGVQRTGQVGCGCNKMDKKWFCVCGFCGAELPRR